MIESVIFRAYTPADKAACLALFDENCPAFFAPNEKADYLNYLDNNPAGYEVCFRGDNLVGVCGMERENTQECSITWIMLSGKAKGLGLGDALVKRAIEKAKAGGYVRMHIATSQHADQFFARFGAVEKTSTKDGWGAGMHRIDMELILRD